MNVKKCIHKFNHGPREGQTCNKDIRGDGPKCHDHTRKRVFPKCPHGRNERVCVDCGGGGICIHKRRSNRCKECKGKSICPHNKVKYRCKLCKGKGICVHGRDKYICTQCDNATGVCEHKREKTKCKICDPAGHLVHRVRYHTWRALKENKILKSAQYLNCDIEDFRLHIESQFKPKMTWDNYGTEWHIDHIVPLQYNNPTMEELIERLDFTNC